jgi:hypothetical protein
MIIEIDNEKLAKIQHLLNFENKLIIKINKSNVSYDSIRELFDIDVFFILNELGITHQKIRQMWDDDNFDNCLNSQIAFTFEFRLFLTKSFDNQISLFTTKVRYGQYHYSY